VDSQISLRDQLNDPNLSRDQRALIRCQLAKQLEEAGDFEGARGAMGELWQRVGEPPHIVGLDRHTAAEVLLRAGVLSGFIGSAQQIEGAQEIAKDLISKSVTIFEVLQETEKAAEALTELANCYWRAGAYDDARVTLEDVLSRLADKDGETKAIALLRLSVVENSATRFHESLCALNKAAPIVESINNHSIKGRFHVQLATALKNLGESESREDYTDRALIEYAAASFHFEQAGHTRYRAAVENNLGGLYLVRGRLAEAREHLDRARRLFVRLKDRVHTAQVDETRARLLLAQGRNREAEKVGRAAVRTLEQGDEQSLLAEALATHGAALARLGHDEQARLAFHRAIEVAHQAGAYNDAGHAALTMFEELGERLAPDEMRIIYQRADHLLAFSDHQRTLHRLRQAARRVLAAERARRGADIKEVHAPNFLYASEQMAALLRDAQRIAHTSNPVLITGEIGTGKELLARLIHEWSGRSGKFVTINCVALSETMVESQLFGQPKGRRETAKDQQGAVHQATGGTLFLEEIDELSTSDQGKLLRLIDRDEIHSIEASTTEQVDVRIIAATNSNLQEDVARELFRADLYYRLQPFELHIPPLRERPEDIPVLAAHFITGAYEQYGERVVFTPEAIEAMQQLPLKGNAQELRSLIERTVLTAPEGATIMRDAVETFALRQTQTGDLANLWAGCSLIEEVRRYEGSLIQKALDATQGHITRAARLLGITHQGLAYILQGRQKDLLWARTPVRRRRRSIKGKKRKRR
jgi:DNA-binding NtrC family response regulator/tetratricopeptide (TPR) repeat protein